MLVERAVLPERVDWLEPEVERVASEVLRAVLPVERLVRVFWSTVPAEREVEELELRLVRSFWFTVPAERAVEEPVLRLVVVAEELPVLRLVRVF